MSVGILGEEREPGLGKLGWHGSFDTGFESNISFKIPCTGFLNLFEIPTDLLFYPYTIVKQSFFLRFDNIIHYEFPDKVQRQLQRQKQVYAYLGLCLTMKDKKTIL